MTPIIEHGKPLTILITIDDKTFTVTNIKFYDPLRGFIQTNNDLFYLPKELSH